MGRITVLVWMSLAFGVLACGSQPEVPPVEVPAEVDERLSASVLLIGWQGLRYEGEAEPPTRTENAAYERAVQLRADVVSHADDFADFVRENSDGPRAKWGGRQMAWRPEEQPEEMRAVIDLKVGEISEPIRGNYGWLLIRREAPLPQTVISGRRMVVAWRGAERAPADLTRTRAVAKAKAQVLAKNTAPGDFEALILASSDGHDQQNGGFMGTWELESGRVEIGREVALSKLTENELSPPIRTEYGYEILQRLAPASVEKLLAGSHVLISHSGAVQSKSDRTPEQALARANQALEMLESGTSFVDVVKEYSDDGTAETGGNLGSWRPGTKLPAELDVAMASLKMWQHGGVVKSPYGYHLLSRRPSPDDRVDEYLNPGSNEAAAVPVHEDKDKRLKAPNPKGDAHDHEHQ